jgi:alpha-N-arabinofuranosidase
MANIAQMINVLQAMILTDGPKMVLTPTYDVFRMYVPFQDATFIPVSYDAGSYVHGDTTLPRLDAIAARGKDGKLWLSLTNLDPNHPLDVDAAALGFKATSADGQTLSAPKVDSVNTFDHPRTVSPKPISGTLKNGAIVLTLPPASVTVVSLQP